jgi:hypothetical protein
MADEKNCKKYLSGFESCAVMRHQDWNLKLKHMTDAYEKSCEMYLSGLNLKIETLLFIKLKYTFIIDRPIKIRLSETRDCTTVCSDWLHRIRICQSLKLIVGILMLFVEYRVFWTGFMSNPSWIKPWRPKASLTIASSKIILILTNVTPTCNEGQ